MQKNTEFDLGLPLNSIETPYCTERMYVAALVESKAHLHVQLDIALPRIDQALERSRSALIAEDWSVFEEAFAPVAGDAIVLLNVRAMRREFSFEDPAPDYDQLGLPQLYEIVPVSKGNESLLVVAVPGLRNMVFSLSGYPKAQTALIHEVANRFAQAIARRYKPDALVAIEAMRAGARQRRERGHELLRLCDEQLSPHLRFAVEVVVTNAGRSAFSIGGRAVLSVGLSGYPGRNGAVPRDVALAMFVGVLERRGDKDELSARRPVLVAPGEARSLVAVSEHPVGELEYRDELLQAFNGGTVRANAELAVMTGGSDFDRLSTNRVLFRDLAGVSGLDPAIPDLMKEQTARRRT